MRAMMFACALDALILGVPALALAQAARPPIPGTQAYVPANPEVSANTEAMDKMMAGMHRQPTGDADQDFVAGMIPHHQGAIDMAEIELKYGQDPKLKQLAARIISAQQREIAVMQAWAAKHPAPSGPHVDNPHIQWK